MYRNICYKMDTNNHWNGNIILFTWDQNGKRIKKEIPHESYLYYEDSLGNDLSIYNTKIKKKTFKNTSNRRKWLEENPDTKIYECLYPTMEYLQNEYYKKNNDILNFTKYPLRICFMDIEVAVEDEFPTAKEAKYPINVISFYDNITNKKYSYILGEAVITDPNIVLYKFTNEIDLLNKFLKDFKEFEFDIITGWNTICFDTVYIYNRLKRMFDETVANSLSPIGVVRSDKIHLHGDPMDYERVIIEGISQLDYFILYKHFVTPVEGLKSSYTLDYIGKEETGEGKLTYEKDLRHLYKNDFQKFVEYNLQDVDLVVKIDKKRKFINLTRHLCNISLIEYEKIFVSSAPVVGAILQLSKDLNLHLPYNRQDNKEESELIGAFVKEPEKKAYRKGVTAFDIQSLYPNIMIAFNISPETFLGKIFSYDNNIHLRTKDGKIIPLTKEQYDKLKLDNNYCVAANGSVYTTKKEGIIPIFLKKFFNDRLKLKNEGKKLKKEINKLKNEHGDEKLIEELKNKEECIDLEQITRKIILNTTYGVCGSRHSIFYNINNGEATTLTGQSIIKSAGDYIDSIIKSNYIDNQENKSFIIYTDTDSVAGDSLIRTDSGIFKVEDLYNICSLQKENKKYLTNNGHERLQINSELKTFSYTNKLELSNIKHIFRHKVSKLKYKIVVDNKEVIVTGDHSCMVYRDNKLIEVKAHEILETDKMVIIDIDLNIKSKIVDITYVEDIGFFEDEYVYDIEVDSEAHNFFANDILVHNSLYVDTEPVMDKLFNGKLTNIDGIVKELNIITDNLNNWCKTELSHNIFNMYQKDRINFSRDCFCDKAFFFAKKRYILHIVEEEGEKTDKVKYKGISLVRSTYPKFMKNEIKNIYEKTIREDWNENNFIYYMNNLYDDFSKRGFEEISLFKKINCYKESDGEFLEVEKGTTGHGKAAQFYNQLIKKLKINDKYDYIKNDNMRLCYILKNNEYNIDVIGFKDSVPDEFKKIFIPDYKKMFDLLFLKALRDFCECNKWSEWDNFNKLETNIEDF